MKIVYLAPEIPALSATFVYNELLAVEALGHKILPISVHHPVTEATDSKLNSLKQRVRYLYAHKKFFILKSHFRMVLSKPILYLKSLGLCLKDIISLGVLKRDALALIYRFFYAVYMAKILCDEQVEHVHVHFAHVPTDIAMYACRIAEVPFSVMAHANDIFERGLLITEKVERASFFATITEFNRQFIASEYHVDKNKLPIIRCGVESKSFTEKFDTALSNPLKIGVVGRLVEKKGIDTLIDACYLLTKNNSVDIIIEIAGSGPLEKELKEQVDKLCLHNSIFFLGALSHEKVAAFLKQLDLFVLPCKRDSNGDMDGLPVVLMEAMVVGTPVISTQLSGIPELVIDHQTGLLVSPDNAAQLAQSIMSLIEDDELRKQLVKNAMAKIKEEFTQDVNAKRLEALFFTD